MGSKTRLSSYCTKRGNNGVNLVTSRKINTRLARPISFSHDHSYLTLVLQRSVSAGIEALIERTGIADCSCEQVLFVGTGRLIL